MKFAVVLCLVVACCNAVSMKQERRFPDEFLFGCATASYQVEGAWNEDGKSENIWDHMTHTNPTVIKDQSNGDIAANSYYNYKRDVEMMRELGLDAYRFSMSWSRILPTGISNEVNPAGIAYYNNLINEMLEYNITPMVTLYHWDLPIRLQNMGGFLNPLFSDWFEDYARVVFENFGDRVKLWLTFNEPREICYQGYGADIKSPLINETAFGTYLCGKHLVIAHAKAYHLYNNVYKPTQGGECGITISVNWFGPLTDSQEDQYAAEMRRQGEWGLYADPIFSEEGGFPKDFADRVAENSAKQNYPWSRMPSFTDDERKFVRGAADFLGINHYTGTLVSASDEYKTTVYPEPSLYNDIDVGSYVPPDWPVAASYWLRLSPNSIYNVLTHLHKKYNGVKLYITENGWSDTPDIGLIDDNRITYYRAALESVLDSLEAGVNLKGYMAWSLMDNFEWMQGYTECFGLYQVDFNDPARTRTARKSALVYKNIIKTRTIDHSYEPESLSMTIDDGK